MAVVGRQIQTQCDLLRMPRANSGWVRLATLLVVGYLCLYRSFAYLGFPWLHIYVGELSLAAFLCFGPKTARGPWLNLVQRVCRFKRLWAILVLVLFYGMVEVLRGVLRGFPALTAVRDTAFNYYPIFVFLGTWVGLQDVTFLPRVVHVMAWFNGCYGLACVLFLSRVPWTVPGTAGAASPVPLFSEPSGASAVVLLGLMAFEPQLRRVWHLVALNAFVLLGLQVRGEWLGFAVGALVFALLTRKLRYLAAAAIPFAVLLVFMYAGQFSLQSPKGRGENVGTKISTDYLVARAIAPFSKDIAQELAPAEDVGFAAGTAEWRLVWWANIWSQVHARLSSALLGFGYGYPIGDLNPEIESGTFIQTPHSDFFYALAFSGWLGVILFGLLQIEIARLLWQGYQITGQPFGLMCWAAFLAMSVFEPFFEEPFGAIPFFLLLGAAIGPALLVWKRPPLNDVPELLPAAPEAQSA